MMTEPVLYVEMLADGTVPEKVQVSRTRPLVLEDETGNRMDLESGQTYYTYLWPVPPTPGVQGQASGL